MSLEANIQSLIPATDSGDVTERRQTLEERLSEFTAEQAQAPQAEAASASPETQAPAATPLSLNTFPSTAEGLRVFCVHAFNDLLQNPSNAAVLASVVINGLATALKNDQQRLHRDMVRPVLVKDYFAGSVRATTIAHVGEHGEQLSATLEIQNRETKAWEALDVEAEKQHFLIKLVLARATVPGEVWFLTTSAALEEAATNGAKVLEAAHGV